MQACLNNPQWPALCELGDDAYSCCQQTHTQPLLRKGYFSHFCSSLHQGLEKFYR